MRNRLRESELKLQYQMFWPQWGCFDPQATVEGSLQQGADLSIVPLRVFTPVVPNKDIGSSTCRGKVRVDLSHSLVTVITGRSVTDCAGPLAPDSTQNFYRFPVKLALKRSVLESDGVEIPLKAGMAITTNLKLRDKRVISLVSDLLVDQTDSVRSIRQQ